jgi:hypothetical protein
MGKRRKRLTMPKYDKKYAAKRAAMAALRGETPPAPAVEEPVVETPTPEPEPVVEITEPEPEPEPVVEEVKPEPKKTLPNALNTKAKPKTTTKKTTTRKRTTRTRKTTTKTATKS